MSSVVLNKINGDSIVANQHVGENSKKAQVQHVDKNVDTKIKTQDVKNISPSEIKNMIDKINENVGILNKDVKFVYNDTIKSLVVKVINAKTGKLIREIPPKEVINLQKKLSEVVGIIFDSKEVQ